MSTAKKGSKKERKGPAKAGRAAAKTRRPAATPRRAKSPVTAALRKKLRDAMIAQKERIMGDFMSLRQTHLRSSQRESAGDLSGYSLHMADIGTDTFDREFALTVASSEQDVLYRIDQALRRMEEKQYGLCESCGRAIKLSRLKAMPWARLCLPCKRKEEEGVGEES